MARKFIVAILVASLAISGCTKKTTQGAIGMLPPVAPAGNTPIDDTHDALARLQNALISAAGADRILFDLDSSALSNEAREILPRQAGWLRQNPSISFMIEGHCDERGTRNYNLALGERRAVAVANFVAGLGISPDKLRTISYGKERPEATGSDGESFAQNRRAVSVVLAPEGF
jgi:peptidoglycan-associated lipoprotein